MLKRLKERGFEIDGFYYPFECNPPEKQFIISCRKYFPNAEIIGFQHTAFFPNQLAYHLGPNEKNYHPLPDKIICSGPIYMKLHKEARFPSEILVGGPNLRFESVYVTQNYKDNIWNGQKKRILLPFTFIYDLSFVSIAKVKEALGGIENYQMCIRNHPLLSKKKLVKFLKNIGVNNYEFVDEGIIQEWFAKTHVVISTGGSITIIEAIAYGVPVIRVIPDNTIFYDPCFWPDYPLQPVNSADSIREQIELINKMNSTDRNIFSKIGREVLTQYFTKPTEDNLKVFLL
jgi:hypothetical protein